jgi:hypothetical protein
MIEKKREEALTVAEKVAQIKEKEQHDFLNQVVLPALKLDPLHAEKLLDKASEHFLIGDVLSAEYLATHLSAKDKEEIFHKALEQLNHFNITISFIMNNIIILMVIITKSTF